jgi:hypothetical protein
MHQLTELVCGISVIVPGTIYLCVHVVDQRSLRADSYLQKARNAFVADYLEMKNVTLAHWTTLSKEEQDHHSADLEDRFRGSFFDYCQGVEWSRHAVGPNDAWIHLEGMAAWHVSAAMAALKSKRSTSSGSSPLFSPGRKTGIDNRLAPPFDPVKDAADSYNSASKVLE